MLTSIDPQQRGFACADESLPEAYLEELVHQRTRRLVELFVRCFRQRLVRDGAGLDDAVSALVGAPFATAWHEGLGRLRRTLLEQPLDAERATQSAVAIALALAADRQAIAFDVTLDRPSSFRFGRHVLPPIGKIHFRSDGVTASFDGDLDSAFTFSPLASEWTGALAAKHLVRVGSGGDAVLLLPTLPEGADVALRPSDADHEDVRAAYEAAFAVIHRYAPSYRAWVRRSIKTIVPILGGRAGTTTSSSFEHSPGVVALSHASPPLAMADALVHEASHQHYYLLTQLGPVHDGSDTRLYWSPARRAERPIDKILLAYHAFGNVLLFYRHCRAHMEHGEDRAFCEGQERDYEASLVELARPLETTTALTPIGRALFEPLRMRLTKAIHDDQPPWWRAESKKGESYVQREREEEG
jgi:HEXXH motif-containing protein